MKIDATVSGDGFTSEGYASDIEYINSGCVDTWDGCWDVKGGPIYIDDGFSFRDGNRAIRAWNGPVHVTNTIAGYVLSDADSTDSNYVQITQRATGSNAGFWAVGVMFLDRVTSVNNSSAFRFGSDTGLREVPYVSGSGTVPIPGRTLVTGGTSGVKARVAGYTGNAVSGTLFVYGTTGTWTDGEAITGADWETGSADGFSATVGTYTATRGEGQITYENSIIALTADYASYSTTAADESGGDYTLTDGGNNVVWIQGVSGTDPQFRLPTNRTWMGDNNDFDSALYTNTKGYYRNGSEDNTHRITLSDVEVSR